MCRLESCVKGGGGAPALPADRRGEMAHIRVERCPDCISHLRNRCDKLIDDEPGAIGRDVDDEVTAPANHSEILSEEILSRVEHVSFVIEPSIARILDADVGLIWDVVGPKWR
jgi:hypothetical protein